MSDELTPQEKRSRFQQILRSAKKHKRIRGGIIHCENCDNPADEVSIEVGWAGCGPCIWGEADSLDSATFLRADWQPSPPHQIAGGK